jgi:hypothetical protein
MRFKIFTRRMDEEQLRTAQMIADDAEEIRILNDLESLGLERPQMRRGSKPAMPYSI